jgi:hypothetical protein
MHEAIEVISVPHSATRHRSDTHRSSRTSPPRCRSGRMMGSLRPPCPHRAPISPAHRALLALQDFYTKEIRGDCTIEQIHALLDLVDTDGDGAIKYMEFARILSLDDLAGYVISLQGGGKKTKPPLNKAVIR